MEKHTNSLIKSLVGYVYNTKQYPKRANNIQDHLISEYLEESPVVFNLDLVKEDFTSQFLINSSYSVRDGYCSTLKNDIENSGHSKDYDKIVDDYKQLTSKTINGKSGDENMPDKKLDRLSYHLIENANAVNRNSSPILDSFNSPTFNECLKYYSRVDDDFIKRCASKNQINASDEEIKINTPVRLICAYIQTKFILNEKLAQAEKSGEDTTKIKQEIKNVTSDEARFALASIVRKELRNPKYLFVKNADIQNKVYDTLKVLVHDNPLLAQRPNMVESYFRSTGIETALFDNGASKDYIPKIDNLRKVYANGFTRRIFTDDVKENAQAQTSNIVDLISNINVQPSGVINDVDSARFYKALNLIKKRVKEDAIASESIEASSYITYLTFSIIHALKGKEDHKNQIGAIISDPLIQAYHLINDNKLDLYANVAVDIAKDIAKESGKLDAEFENYLNGLKKSLINAENENSGDGITPQPQPEPDPQPEPQPEPQQPDESPIIEQVDEISPVDDDENKPPRVRKPIKPNRNSGNKGGRVAGKKRDADKNKNKNDNSNNAIEYLQQLVDTALEDNEISLRTYGEIQKGLETLQKEQTELNQRLQSKEQTDRKVEELKQKEKSLSNRLRTAKGQLTSSRKKILRSFRDEKFVNEAHASIKKLLASKKQQLSKSEKGFKNDLQNLKEVNKKISDIQQKLDDQSFTESLVRSGEKRKVSEAKAALKKSRQSLVEIEKRIAINTEEINNTQMLVINANPFNIKTIQDRVDLADANIKKTQQEIYNEIKLNPNLKLGNIQECQEQKSILTTYLNSITSQIKQTKEKTAKASLIAERENVESQIEICDKQLEHFNTLEKRKQQKENAEKELSEAKKLDYDKLQLKLKGLHQVGEQLRTERVNIESRIKDEEEMLKNAQQYANDSTPAKSHLIKDTKQLEQELDDLREQQKQLVEKLEQYFFDEQVKALMKETKLGTFDQFFGAMDEYDKLDSEHEDIKQQLDSKLQEQLELEQKVEEQSKVVSTARDEIVSILDNMLAQKYGLWLVETDIKNSDKPIKKHDKTLQKEKSILADMQNEYNSMAENFRLKYGYALRDVDSANEVYKTQEWKEIEDYKIKIDQQEAKVAKLKIKLNKARETKTNLESKRNQIIKTINSEKETMIGQIDSGNLQPILDANQTTIQTLNASRSTYITMERELRQLAKAMPKDASIISEEMIDRYVLDSDKYSSKYSRAEIYNALLEIAKANYSKDVLTEIRRKTRKSVVGGVIEILKNPERYVISENLQEIIDSETLKKLIPITQAVKKAEVRKQKEEEIKAKKEKLSKKPNPKKERNDPTNNGRSL